MPLMLNGKEVVPKLNKDLKAVYLGNRLIYKSSTQLLLSGISSNAILVSKDGLNYQRKTVTTPAGDRTTMFTSFGTVNGKIWAANTNGIYITEDLINYTTLIGKPSNMDVIYKNNVANIGSQFVGIFQSYSNSRWYFNYTNNQGTSWNSNTLIETNTSFMPYKLMTFNNKFLLLGTTGIIHLDVNDNSTKIKKCNFTLLDGSIFTTQDKMVTNLQYFTTDGTIYNNKLYVVMHKKTNDTTDYRYSIFESIDGINYTEICTIPTTSWNEFSNGIVGLMVKNNTITFLGNGGSGSTKLCKSLDLGNTWSKLTFPYLSSIGSVTKTNLLKFKNFIIYNGIATTSSASSGGNNIASQNILISSDDGATWNKASSGGNWGTPGSFVCLETELNI